MICLFQETFNNSLDKIVDLLWIKTIIKIEKHALMVTTDWYASIFYQRWPIQPSAHSF